MIDAYSDIIQQWARVRHDMPPMALHELLDCTADRPELVRHARYVAALANIVTLFMQIEPEAGETIH